MLALLLIGAATAAPPPEAKAELRKFVEGHLRQRESEIDPTTDTGRAAIDRAIDGAFADATPLVSFAPWTLYRVRLASERDPSPDKITFDLRVVALPGTLRMSLGSLAWIAAERKKKPLKSDGWDEARARAYFLELAGLRPRLDTFGIEIQKAERIAARRWRFTFTRPRHPGLASVVYTEELTLAPNGSIAASKVLTDRAIAELSSAADFTSRDTDSYEAVAAWKRQVPEADARAIAELILALAGEVPEAMKHSPPPQPHGAQTAIDPVASALAWKAPASVPFLIEEIHASAPAREVEVERARETKRGRVARWVLSQLFEVYFQPPSGTAAKWRADEGWSYAQYVAWWRKVMKGRFPKARAAPPPEADPAAVARLEQALVVLICRDQLIDRAEPILEIEQKLARAKMNPDALKSEQQRAEKIWKDDYQPWLLAGLGARGVDAAVLAGTAAKPKIASELASSVVISARGRCPENRPEQALQMVLAHSRP